MQKCYLDGLAEDETVPFSWGEDPGEDATPGMAGPTIREGVDAGVKVINLSEMREQLEAERARRLKGGDG